MFELSALKKNKINLADYNSQLDIENRIMLADFSMFEQRILEEILFSSLKISLKNLSDSVECSPESLFPVLEKLTKAGLLILDRDAICVDKEMRKYFECQIDRFNPDFKPDMEFLQALLRKVPIHILPTWYAIPRTSSNIFESILEKYLLTPQIFNRYIGEILLGDGKMSAIIRDIYSSESFQVCSSDLIELYNLSRYEFEEIMVLLELNFVACLSYVKDDDHWIEIASPFYEWRQYLLYLKETQPPIVAEESVSPRRETDFAFVEDLANLLRRTQKEPIDVRAWNETEPLSIDLTRALSAEIGLHALTELTFAQKYIKQLLTKACLVKLAALSDGRLRPTDAASDWLSLSSENKATYLHRHSLNRIASYPIDPSWNTEKHIHEAEKSIKRVLHGKWVFFDDFMGAVLVAFDESSTITLKKTGKSWRYTIPKYSEEQRDLIKAAVFEWLFEAGMVSIGIANGRDCFRVTDFGRCFF